MLQDVRSKRRRRYTKSSISAKSLKANRIEGVEMQIEGLVDRKASKDNRKRLEDTLE